MATVVSASIYKINSNQIVDRNLYPYGMPIAFGAASIVAQPNTGTTLAQLQDGTTALIYSRIKSAATGDTVFFSNLTVAAIVSAANA